MEYLDALRVILFLAALISLETWTSGSSPGARCNHLRRSTPHDLAFNAIQVLELEPDASKAEVRSAFRRLAKIYHPDVVGTGDATKFQAILQAANVLSSRPEVVRPEVVRDEFDQLFDDLIDMEAVAMEEEVGGDIFREWLRVRTSRNEEEDYGILDSLTDEEVVERVSAILALYFGFPPASVSSQTTLFELGFFKEYDYDVSDVLMALEMEFDVDLVDISTERREIRFDLPLAVQTVGEFAEFVASRRT
eukprot:TRINITY_DN107048_c0_g1_i1.p1 TRINITY_DN107048_c0_g1~~TRINITY_DN107048_c0_g1_i1.p1  ORF type:complete len:250 (-),score=52.95 TRINITY_DN107048_c0_g1_i1:667-1416(-)